MQLRAELEPQMEVAKSRYYKILDLITRYEEYVDEFGDDDNEEYLSIEGRMHRMTGKDMSRYNFYQTWEEEAAEVLAFRISLPDPLKVEDITSDELREIITRIREYVYPDQGAELPSFEDMFSLYLDDYYHGLLKLNFEKYKRDYFNRQRDGKEYTIDQIMEQLQ